MHQESESESPEVSFFKLAERYDMPRGRKRRWRDRRDTLPACRRRRRAHRRDRDASRHYLPMEVDANSASRGIRARLAGAMISALVTVACVLSIILAPEITLAAIFPFTVAVGSLGLSIALTMSARREEIVHQVAGRLTRDADPPALPAAELDAQSIDAQIIDSQMTEAHSRHTESDGQNRRHWQCER